MMADGFLDTGMMDCDAADASVGFTPCFSNEAGKAEGGMGEKADFTRAALVSHRADHSAAEAGWLVAHATVIRTASLSRRPVREDHSA